MHETAYQKAYNDGAEFSRRKSRLLRMMYKNTMQIPSLKYATRSSQKERKHSLT